MRGENHKGTKLTDAKITEMRAIYANGGVCQYSLASQFGISQSLVSQIVRRKIWKHLQ